MSKTFNIVAAALIVLLAVGLYKAKTEADVARAHVAKLQAQVEAARAQIKTLSAEAAYLDNPDRIEKLSRQQLGLKQAELSQHRPIADLDKALPPAQNARAKAAP